jgi:hypothetical protein
MMSGRVTVIPVDTSTEFPISGCPIPVEAIQDECERGMSLAERVVNSRARTAAGFAVGSAFLAVITYCQSPNTRTYPLTRCTLVDNSGL